MFGPKRLPELGRTLGKTLKGFQSASNEFEREIQKAMSETETIESSDDSSSIDLTTSLEAKNNPDETTKNTQN